MKKPEIARQWAHDFGVSPAEAADRLDRVVCQILTQLRKGRVALLPGIGTLRLRTDGKVTFESEGGRYVG